LAGNVGLALQTFHPGMDFETAFAKGYEAVRTGAAIHHLKKIAS